MHNPATVRQPGRLTSLRSNPNGTVVLFGEVLADIFPDKTVLGGAPFNVARHLKSFGLNPILITRLGDDALREDVLKVMTQHKMETLGVQCNKTHPTGQVKVHIEKGSHRFEILPQQAYDFIHPAVVRMTTLSANPALVYFGTLAQRNDISKRALSSLFRSTDALKFLDINLRSPWYDEVTLRQSLSNADNVKLNDDELNILSDMFELPGQDPHSQVKALINRFDLQQVMVTCGGAGAWQTNREGKKIVSKPAPSDINLVDTVGAGDGFAAVCILGSLKKWPAANTLERANTFAAAICEIRGAAPDHADFYEPFTANWKL